MIQGIEKAAAALTSGPLTSSVLNTTTLAPNLKRLGRRKDQQQLPPTPLQRAHARGPLAAMTMPLSAMARDNPAPAQQRVGFKNVLKSNLKGPIDMKPKELSWGEDA